MTNLPKLPELNGNSKFSIGNFEKACSGLVALATAALPLLQTLCENKVKIAKIEVEIERINNQTKVYLALINAWLKDRQSIIVAQSKISSAKIENIRQDLQRLHEENLKWIEAFSSTDDPYKLRLLDKQISQNKKEERVSREMLREISLNIDLKTIPSLPPVNDGYIRNLN